ncbi:MAG: efflux RND transporter periplasmic adaptor subunit [Proteobacteria bacterium]|nr:efflux RND transporter periplasmic adaptor subunit [Pseudomonadota bacterium]
MKKFFTRVLPPMLVIVASFFIVQALVAAKPTPEKKPQEQRLLSLFVDEVQSDTVNFNVNSHGEVKPQTQIDLTSLVSGQILSISDKFAEGSKFTVGAALIKIDDRDYKVAVIRAQAQVATAKVNVERELANSKIKKEQWQRKHKGQPSDFALNKPQIAEARALLKAAQADLDAAELNLQRTQITAPFTGRVLNENIAIGQYITPATLLGNIFSTEIVEVRLPLTDSQLVELSLPMGFMAKQDNAPTVTFTAKVGSNSHQWQGKIVRTNAAIDKETRLIYAIAEMSDPYSSGSDNGVAMAVGMYVNASIHSNKSKETLRFPRLALHSNDKVYVINEDSKLEIRKVVVLSTNQDYVHVASGVSVGEKVVTSAVPSVSDGMEVIAIDRNSQVKNVVLTTEEG